LRGVDFITNNNGSDKTPIGRGITAVLLLLTATGCGQSTPLFSPIDARLSRLGLSYGLYAGKYHGKTPSNLEELRRYVGQSVTSEQLTALGVNSVDALFVSPRDGKPYTLIPLPHLPPPVAGEQPPVVLYEQIGQQGKRYVAYLGGGVEEVDAERFRQLVPLPPQL
jgi:hypothetical protein